MVPLSIVRPESNARVRQLESDEGDPLTSDRQCPALSPIPDDRPCPGVPMSTTSVYTSARGSNFPSTIMPKNPSVVCVPLYFSIRHILVSNGIGTPSRRMTRLQGRTSCSLPQERSGQWRSAGRSTRVRDGGTSWYMGSGRMESETAPSSEMQNRALGNHDLVAWLQAP